MRWTNTLIPKLSHVIVLSIFFTTILSYKNYSIFVDEEVRACTKQSWGKSSKIILCNSRSKSDVTTAHGEAEDV